MKAKQFKRVKKFQDIPNVGRAMERDFRLLGLRVPADLLHQDPFKLYKKLCNISGVRQDLCVLDTYMAVIDFVHGGVAKPWYQYTKLRKVQYLNI